MLKYIQNRLHRDEEWSYGGQPELGQVFNSVAEALQGLIQAENMFERAEHF